MLKCESNIIQQAFVEHLFVHLSVIIALQYVLKLQSFVHKTKH